MEFALESAILRSSISSRANASSPNTFLTPVWQSSKLPRTPQTDTFEPVVVTICLRWMSLTPPSGYSTPTLTWSTSLKPSSAALPVSPDVATRIMKSWSILPSSCCFSTLAEKKRGRHCSAMSLNALVGPCHSSSTCVSASSEVIGQISGVSKLSP